MSSDQPNLIDPIDAFFTFFLLGKAAENGANYFVGVRFEGENCGRAEYQRWRTVT